MTAGRDESGQRPGRLARRAQGPARRAQPAKKPLIDRLFHWGVVGKGVYGAVELLLGILLTLVTTTTLQGWADALTQRELIHDPNDFLATLITSKVDGLTASAILFVSVYLIAHGVVKLGLLLSVVTRAYRVYPWAIAVLVAFIGYQVFDLIVAFSVGLLLLTVFDVVIVALTWRDYRGHAKPRLRDEPTGEVADEIAGQAADGPPRLEHSETPAAH